MAGRAGLKAGLIGAGVMLVVTLLNLIPVPFLGCVCCGLAWLAYAGIGALAGRYLDPPRTAGAGAGAGAIAGLISGATRGVIMSIVIAVQTALGSAGDITSMLDPEMLRQLRDLGVDPEMFAVFTGVGGVALAGGLCCLGALAAGALFGALGGVIYSSTNAD